MTSGNISTCFSFSYCNHQNDILSEKIAANFVKTRSISHFCSFSEFDVGNLIESLLRLTHTGHTFVIVEHHDLFKRYAHHIVKLGPGGGIDGGKIVERIIFKNVD